MFGAVLGNIIGSPYEFDSHNIKTKEFELFSAESEYTDDGIMTVAVADALLKAGPGADDETLRGALTDSLQAFGRAYPMAGYGMDMTLWLHEEDPSPMNTDSNEAAARVASVPWLIQEDFLRMRHVARLTASVINSNPETVKGADAVASVIFMALHGEDREAIRSFVTRQFSYDLTGTADQIREGYSFTDTASGSVPQAILCFLEGKSYEDAVRTAVSIGGDSDTIACMTGAMAEAAYGVPDDLREVCRAIVPTDMRQVMEGFEKKVRADKEAREADPARMEAWQHVFERTTKKPVPQKLRPAGNEPVEEAVRAWKEADGSGRQDAFNRVCAALNKRLHEGARVLAPGQAVRGGEGTEGKNTFQLQLVRTRDGKFFQPLYTSEEELKRARKEAVMVVSFTIRELFTRVMQLAGQDNEFGRGLQGILINPGADEIALPLKIVETMLKLPAAPGKGQAVSRILFAKGDIRTLKCGCLVLEDGRGRPGQLRSADAGKVSADRLFMTMIPAYDRKRPHLARAAAAEAVRRGLDAAKLAGAVSCAFPPLGTGLRAGAIPLGDAVRTILMAAAQWIRENPGTKMDIIFCTDSDGIFEEFKKAMPGAK